MATKPTQSRNLESFTEALKLQVLDYLSSNGLKQAELARRMDFTPSAMSANLRKNHTMTENFIRRLSATVPEFSDAILTYFELKGDRPLPRAARDAVATRKSKAERIKMIRQTEKEVQAAVHGLFEELVKLVDGD